MKKRWIISRPDFEGAQQICREAGCHPVVAAILAKRGVKSKKDTIEFLNPSFDQFRSFNKLIDLPQAVNRIAKAIIHRENILVFGDYDVDGVTSTAILYDFLKNAGAQVSYYIPDRMSEGYGLIEKQIENIALPRDVHLIITADCGSGSYDAIARAKACGIDVIVTDHHRISYPLPDALAIVNPQRQDCPSGSKCFAGVGVVFCLVICLRKHLRDIKFWNFHSQPNLKEYCDLVALGTISDIVPMIRENRIITKTGIDVINKNPRPGIKALLETAGISKPYIDDDYIAYRIGPRINAAGRMDHAEFGVELLLTKDNDRATQLAEKLNALNSLRQKEEVYIFNQIEKFLKDEPSALEKKALVLSGHDLHEGVLGIVASRLIEKFYRPVILISFKKGIGKGSGRSIPGINIFDALAACSKYLDNFGGHPMAAGIQIKSEQYAQFKDAFERTVAILSKKVEPGPSLEIDYELNFDKITENLIDGLNSLQPFGPQNPEPVFYSKHIEITFSKIIGSRHLRLMVKQKNNATPSTSFTAVWFNADEDLSERRYIKEIAYRLRKNYWNGSQSIQLVIEDIR
jgi:single-stranded-DNA-specific exonuclease